MAWHKKLILPSLILLSSCASDESTITGGPEEMFKAAEAQIADESYLEAEDTLNKLRTEFPHSKYAIEAIVKEADLYFDQGDFLEAASGYSVFVELYPAHKQAPYSQYRKALSLLNDAPERPARDQSSAKSAMYSAKRVLRQFPNSQYTEKAKDLYFKARTKLAAKEAYIARFYQKKKHHKAALRRWKKIINSYKDVAKTDDGKKLISEAKENISKLGAS